MDLTDQLDRSVGPVPERDPEAGPDLGTAALISGGRRVVRRRRRAVAAAAAATVVVVTGTVGLAAAGPDDATPPVVPVAIGTTAAAPIGLQPSKAQIRGAARLVTWAGVSWSVPDDVQVVRQIGDPYRLGPTGGSVSLEVRWEAHTYWIATWIRADGSGGYSVTWPGTESTTFETWTAVQLATHPPLSWPPTLQASPGPGSR